MEKQINNQLMPTPKNTWLIITIIITGLIVGGGTLAWQKIVSRNDIYELKKEIIELQKQIAQLESLEKFTQEDKGLEEEEAEEITYKPKNITQGVYGNINYGIGDCFPGAFPDHPPRLYEDYNGDAYIVAKNNFNMATTTSYQRDEKTNRMILPLVKIVIEYIDLTCSPESENNFHKILKNSAKIKVIKGYYETELEAGDYVFMLPDCYDNRWSQRFITVPQDEVIYNEFQFFRCTSY
jgi:hypothetical protein